MSSVFPETSLRTVPSIKLSLAFYGMAIILMSITGVVLAVSGNQSVQLGISLEFLMQWGFIFLPIVFVLRVRRYDLRESLNLNVPEWVPLVSTLLVAPSSCIILHQMLAWQTGILPMPDELNTLIEGVRDVGKQKRAWGFSSLRQLFRQLYVKNCCTGEFCFRRSGED